MCGIAGTTIQNKNILHLMLENTKHRGPDAQGMISVNGIHMGTNRLAILDLRPEANQPFKYKGNYLCFNGEIWNWMELKKGLQEEGYHFKTKCDTEVVAAILTRYGISTGLPLLEGMFAFSWIDNIGCYLARDRFGKIPLWVNIGKGLFNLGVSWCSERKGLKAAGLNGAMLLPPGTYFNVSQKKLFKWYDIEEHCSNVKPIDVAAELFDAVKIRLKADVPVCCLISGGLDSSLILCLAHMEDPNIVAYTAVLDKTKPDLLAARKLCKELGVKLVEVPIPLPTEDSLKDACLIVESDLKTQVEIGAVAIPLAKQIRKDGFRVCLSGEGADELFGGYGSMIIQSRKLSDEGWKDLRLYQLAKMSRGNFLRCSNSFLSSGVECRLPYLSRGLVEYILSLNKDECPPGKILLKKVAKGIVPDWITKRQKETFQGGVGLVEAAERVLSDPRSTYHRWIVDSYGKESKWDK